MSENKQYTIPTEVLEATVRVLGNYQTRLEREIKLLEQPQQVEAHRKLIEIVRRLAAFYSSISPKTEQPIS